MATNIALKAAKRTKLLLRRQVYCSSFLLHTCCSNTLTTTTMFGDGSRSSRLLPIFRTTTMKTTPRFTVARHSLQCALTENNFNNNDDWIVPPLVGDLIPGYMDPGHYIVSLWTKGLEFESAKHLLDYYIQILAKAVGSVEEAKKKIYYVSCESGSFNFGAKIDKQTSDKLQVSRQVRIAIPDFHRDARDNSTVANSPFEFIPVNRNRRLFNIFDYQKLSECKMEGDSGHWLINIDQPGGGFVTTDEFVDCCSEMLATFVGSKEEAKQRIYIIWCIYPFGFGAEIDEETSKKLKDLPNVLDVLRDYAFDIKRKNFGALVIKSSSDEDSAPVVFYKFLVKPDFGNKKSSLLDSDVEDISEDEDPCPLDSNIEDISEAEDTCQLDSDSKESDLRA